MRVTDWTIDTGDGPRPVAVPHSWALEAPVGWEGPAIYRTSLRVDPDRPRLAFHGVSYAARVLVEGAPVGEHRGMWDAWSVDLSPWAGRRVEVTVEVIKNGGETYPVRDVLSGFLPYVFNTFGGIYREVETVPADWSPVGPRVAPRASWSPESGLLRDGKPFYLRGALSWGWYPELGHPNPPDEVVRDELSKLQAMGFNTVKFCLWVPSHRYLELLAEAGMSAWLELPLWDPTGDEARQAEMAAEIERIVLEYRGHDCILLWTVGCELHASTPAEYRRELVERVQQLTGCTLVKDNSGGSEMYGGDLREYGTFEDFHPYCDTPFFPPVIESLMTGPRPQKPIFLGETNDYDVHRDHSRIAREDPYWSRLDDSVNPVGVRWQFDWKTIRAGRLFERTATEANQALERASRSKAQFIRNRVAETFRSRRELAGYVITGMRHTPISTSGMLDDANQPVFDPDEVRQWNGPDRLFLIPVRRPPWVRGGNRPGWMDPQVFFAGQVFFRVGLHSESGRTGRLEWCIDGLGQERCAAATVLANDPREVGQVSVRLETPGRYTLKAEFDGVRQAWPFWVVAKPDPETWTDWSLYDPEERMGAVRFPGGKNLIATEYNGLCAEALREGGKVILLIHGRALKAAPFWRECAFGYEVPLSFADEWEILWGVSLGGVIAPTQAYHALGEPRRLMTRIDTRTALEDSVIERVGNLLAASLRLWGGLGAQPQGLAANPSGWHVLRELRKVLDS